MENAGVAPGCGGQLFAKQTFVPALCRTEGWSCQLHDINAYDYLVDVLQRVDRHPASSVALLTPRLWKQHFADQRLRSTVESLLA